MMIFWNTKRGRLLRLALGALLVGLINSCVLLGIYSIFVTDNVWTGIETIATLVITILILILLIFVVFRKYPAITLDRKSSEPQKIVFFNFIHFKFILIPAILSLLPVLAAYGGSAGRLLDTIVAFTVIGPVACLILSLPIILSLLVPWRRSAVGAIWILRLIPRLFGY